MRALWDAVFMPVGSSPQCCIGSGALWYARSAPLAALRGAEVIFYPTGICWHPSEKEEFGKAQYSAWETIQRSHAIANGCYVAVPNRVGHEAPASGSGIEFWGQSFVCGPDGEIVAKASVDQEEIVMADIDWSRVNEQRTHWPFLRDRRVDAYSGLDRRLIDRFFACPARALCSNTGTLNPRGS